MLKILEKVTKKNCHEFRRSKILEDLEKGILKWKIFLTLK